MSDVVNYVDTPVELMWTSADTAEASLTVTKPDGTSVEPAPTVTDDGAAHTAIFTPTVPGRHLLTWSTAGDAKADIVDIWPADPRFLVSHALVVDRLRQVNASGTEYDALPLYIAAASWVVEKLVGPQFLAAKTKSLVSVNGQRAVNLPQSQINEVTSVSIDGTALAAGDYIVDEDAGIVHVDVPRLAKVVIAYTAGGDGVPFAAQMGCLEIIAHAWQQTHQSVSPFGDQADTVATPMTYSIPRRALEWLDSLPKTAGVA